MVLNKATVVPRVGGSVSRIRHLGLGGFGVWDSEFSWGERGSRILGLGFRALGV